MFRSALRGLTRTLTRGRPASQPRKFRRLLWLEALEDRAVPAAISWRGGDGSWHDAAKWSLDRVPEPGDDVTISSPGAASFTVSYSQGDLLSLRSLNGTGDCRLTTSLEISGGNLGISATLQANTCFTLRLAGGTLTVSPVGTSLFSGSSVFDYLRGQIQIPEGIPSFSFNNSTVRLGGPQAPSPAEFSTGTALSPNAMSLAGHVMPGQTVRVPANNRHTNLNLVGNVLNAGLIRLGGTAGGYTAALGMPDGATLTNLSGGIIRGEAGGPVTVSGTLRNEEGGTLTSTGVDLRFTGTYESAGGQVTGGAHIADNSRVRVTASPPEEQESILPLRGDVTLLENDLAEGDNLPRTVLWAQGNGQVSLIVPPGATNAGIIRLGGVAGGYNARLVMSANAPGLINTPNGMIQGRGGAVLSAQGYLTNQGLVEASGANLPLHGTYESAGGRLSGSVYVIDSAVKVTASPSENQEAVIPLRGAITLLENGLAEGDNLPRTALAAQGNGHVSLTVPADAANAGIIRLGGATGGYNATLVIPAGGTLTNLPDGAIQGRSGVNADIQGYLMNQGLVEATGVDLEIRGTYESAGGWIVGTFYVTSSQIKVTASPRDGRNVTITVRGNGTLLENDLLEGDNLPRTTIRVPGSGHQAFTLPTETLNTGTLWFGGPGGYTVTVTTDGTLANGTNGAVQFDAAGPRRLNAQSVSNAGQFFVNTPDFQLTGAFFTNELSGLIRGAGEMDGSQQSGMQFLNDGCIEVPTGADFAIRGRFLNFDSVTRTLARGCYQIAGIFRFDGADIVTLAQATMQLEGPNSFVRPSASQANALAGLAFLIGPNAGFYFLNRSFTTAGNFTINDAVLFVGVGSTFTVTGMLTNFDPVTGTLSGGSYLVGGTLLFTGAAIRRNNAFILMEGSQARILDRLPPNTNALANLEENSGILALLGDVQVVTNATTFTNTGVLYVRGPSPRPQFVASGNLVNTYGILVDGGGSIEVNGDGSQTAQSLLYLTGGGSVLVNGNYSLTDEATLLLDGGGTLQVSGNYTQTANASLVINVGNLGSGNYGRLIVQGMATLDGFLIVNLLPDFEARAGDLYDIITYGSRSGEFAVTDLPPIFEWGYGETSFWLRTRDA